MRNYETIFIANPNASSEQIEEQIKKVEKHIQDTNGETTSVEHWGLRRLAYEVKKNTRGYYVFIKFKAETQINAKLQKFYRLDENIIKYIIVQEKVHKIKGKKADPKAEVKPVKIEVGSDVTSHPESDLH